MRWGAVIVLLMRLARFFLVGDVQVLQLQKVVMRIVSLLLPLGLLLIRRKRGSVAVRNGGVLGTYVALLLMAACSLLYATQFDHAATQWAMYVESLAFALVYVR